MPRALADLDLILPRQLQRGLHRLRAPTSEENRAAAEALAGKVEDFARESLGDFRVELRAVNKLELRCLRRHRVGYFLYAMADEVDDGRAAEVEVFFPGRVEQPHALTPYRLRVVLAERARKHLWRAVDIPDREVEQGAAFEVVDQ